GWRGHASQLSEDHIAWTFIDEIAEAPRDPGRVPVASAPSVAPPAPPAPTYPAALLLQRRSAVALDGVSSISRDRFLAMLAHAMPGDAAPLDAISWHPSIPL